MAQTMKESVLSKAEQLAKAKTSELEMASELKQWADKQYGTAWHCIVGKNYGSFVSHAANHFIYFYIGDTAILLFKTTQPC